MGHPVIDEFCRVPGVSACQPHFFNRVQRELRDTIQPLLDERERLLEEVASLREQLAKKKKPEAVTAGRGPSSLTRSRSRKRFAMARPRWVGRNLPVWGWRARSRRVVTTSTSSRRSWHRTHQGVTRLGASGIPWPSSCR